MQLFAGMGSFWIPVFGIIFILITAVTGISLTAIICLMLVMLIWSMGLTPVMHLINWSVQLIGVRVMISGKGIAFFACLLILRHRDH
jgi:hypothetical protein